MSIQPLKVACGDSGEELIQWEVFGVRKGGRRVRICGFSSEDTCSAQSYSFSVGMAGEGPCAESQEKCPDAEIPRFARAHTSFVLGLKLPVTSQNAAANQAGKRGNQLFYPQKIKCFFPTAELCRGRLLPTRAISTALTPLSLDLHPRGMCVSTSHLLQAFAADLLNKKPEHLVSWT